MKKAIIHQYAYCHDCGKKNEQYVKQAARKWAYNHALSTGHTVTVETGTATTYSFNTTS